MRKLSVITVLLFLYSWVGFSQGKDSLPEVFLNHVYLNIDEQTYRDIEKSDFIKKEFGVFEQRTTNTSSGASWTGTYLYGLNTYIEFFEADDSSDIGITGIGFGTEKSGELHAFYEQNKKDTIVSVSSPYLVTRKYNGKDVNWFYKMPFRLETKTPKTRLWIMEYHPEFLGSWYPELKPDNNSIIRKSIIERYTDKLSQTDRLFKNVEQVYLVVGLDEFMILERHFEKMNFEKVAETRGGRGMPSITFQKNGITFLIQMAMNVQQKGIYSIQFSLREKKEGQQVYTFGTSSKLTINNELLQATWSFF